MSLLTRLRSLFPRTRTARLIWLSCLVWLLLLIGGSIWYFSRNRTESFEITDQLGGNIFPSAILSVATTDAQIIRPADGPYVGNPKSSISITLASTKPNTHVRIELAETPFYARSVSEFVLPKGGTLYTIYPDILWRYEALRKNTQAEPISVVATVEKNGHDMGQRMRTFSVRSINECLLGYVQRLSDGGTRFVNTRLFFAAYVNEENPQIDKLLGEALKTRIVHRFLGYQSGRAETVDRQVYSLWNILQKRKLRYSSVSNSSLSSNVVYTQRVRTFDDAIASGQINCVDGSALFASLLRAINLTPILVQTPGHMFVGYYTDNDRRDTTFLETTMIGDIDLDDYFPEERLDSTMRGKSQEEMSRLTFEKSKEYAKKKFKSNEKHIRNNDRGYMFVEISKGVRRDIQPIGR